MKHRLWLVGLALLVATGVLTTGCDQMWAEDDGLVRLSRVVCGDPDTTTIWAGQHFDAGDVIINNCEESLCVRIEIDEPWMMSESHFAWAATCAELPRNKKGNLVPGQFPLQMVHDPMVDGYRYCVPLGDYEVGDTVAIAVHVVVWNGENEETGWAGTWKGCYKYVVQECYKDVSLPTYPIRMRGWHPWAAEQSYWKVELDGINEAGYNVWNGYWRGWCSEKNVTMNQNTWYTITLLSSQDPTMPDRVKYGTYRGEREWDCINWLLNNKPVGATYQQLQNAFWYLGGEILAKPAGLAGTMVDNALANGQGFRPETGDWIAVITLTPTRVQLCWVEVDP